jgi:dihydrofolate reductase
VIVAANDKNIWVVGGGDLAGQFADVGLFDKIMLGVAPVVLFGDGAALFPRRFLTGSLRLGRVDHDGRFVFLAYRVRNGNRPWRPTSGPISG